MKRNIDLLNGRILPSLTALAVPIMATSLVQMAYNLTDMAWIGRVGSNAVAAVGAAAMYTWLSSGLVSIAKMGGQVKAAHAIGEGNRQEAGIYAGGALWLAVFLGVVYALIVNLFAGPLIGFFGLSDPEIIADAVVYLRITCGLIVMSFLSQTLTGLYTAAGDSRTPFLANCVGMGANMILDPVLIFGIGPFPRLEAAGAAIATVTAQGIVMVVLLVMTRKDTLLFPHVHVGKRVPAAFLKTIIRV
ncbi:MAG: MATE family efflux transporter, partial [Lachnospiraceae bacterium]|nr:MATE family efflux transporter [Lachnospiraceae bacterium]